MTDRLLISLLIMKLQMIRIICLLMRTLSEEESTKMVMKSYIFMMSSAGI